MGIFGVGGGCLNFVPAVCPMLVYFNHLFFWPTAFLLVFLNACLVCFHLAVYHLEHQTCSLGEGNREILQINKNRMGVYCCGQVKSA